MSTPQNPSPNYDAILQSIQQEIQGWKAKLSAKDIRVVLLMKQQKAWFKIAKSLLYNCEW